MGPAWSMFAIEGPALVAGGGVGLEGGLVVTLTTTPLIVALIVSRSRDAPSCVPGAERRPVPRR